MALELTNIMSKIEETVYELISQALPNYTCKRQHYVHHFGHKLFFDFYVIELKVMVEVQGRQHFEFNSFYHSSAEEFKKQQLRDQLKREWCLDNGYSLVYVNYDEVDQLSVEELRCRVING